MISDLRSKYRDSARSESTFAPMGIFPPACTAAAILETSIGGDSFIVATSKAGSVWAKAAVAARMATLHNVTVNLYISILFDFRRKIIAILIMKNLFNAQSEEAGGAESQRQARIELARLDGVDGLPGHIQRAGQLGLRPVALGAQYLQPILHRYRQLPYTTDTIYVRLMRITRSGISALKGIRWNLSSTEIGTQAITATPTVMARALR